MPVISRKFVYLITSIAISVSLLFGALNASGSHAALAAPLASAISVGLGSYNTTLPAGGMVPSNLPGAPVSPKITANVTGPIPTNDWWTSLVWQRYPGNPYGENLHALPLSLHAKSGGMGISYTTVPTITSSSPSYIGEYHYTYSEDFTAGLVGLNSPDSKVDGYSDWTVTAQLSDGSNTLKSTFGHGMPYAYFTKTGGDALLTFTATPTVWSNSSGVLGVTVKGHHYGIFGPSDATWTVGGTTAQSNLAGKNYFSIAVLPDNNPATLSFYQSHAYAFVTNTVVSWSYDQPTAKVTTTYTATTTAMEGTNTDTLMGLYRVHWLNSTAPLTSYSYGGPHGTIKVHEGNSFSTVLTFNGVLPALPDAGDYNDTQLNGYVNDFVASAMFPAGTGTYWTGKNLMRAGNLVRIADQQGNTSARDTLLAAMKAKLEDWFQSPDGKTANMFYYNSQWGTLIGYPAEYGSDGELNDHHFHYAYYIYAAAIIAQYDPTWADNSNWGGMVNLLIADAANAGNDSRFPRLRSFDPYEGYAWASGHAGFGGGNNQESSSESMNFNTALILWGSVTGDTAIRDQGIYMYVNEVQAIEQNWFDINNQVFPAAFNNGTHPAIGMNWGDGGAYATWFSANPEMVQGINFLPIQGGSLYLGRNPAYLATNYNQMVSNIGGAERYWKDIIWEVQALNDPDAAATKFANVGYTPEEGETRAHTYHWIHNLKVMGQLDTTVTADIPTYAVFNKAGTRTYVAYNPGTVGITVSFSNGVNCDVPAGQIIASTTCVSGPTNTPGPTATASNTPTVTLTRTITQTPTITLTPTITSTPTITYTPGPIVANVFYVIDGAAQGVESVLSNNAGTGALTDTIPSAAGGNYIGTPNNPLTYIATGVNGTYNSSNTQFSLYLDSQTGVGNGIQARISYDFTGDNTYDRVETYSYFPTDPVNGFETYTQTWGAAPTSTGSFSNLTNGKVKLELWTVFSSNLALIRTSASAAELQQSQITIPYMASVSATSTPTVTATATTPPTATGTTPPTETATTPPTATVTPTETATATSVLTSTITPTSTKTRTPTPAATTLNLVSIALEDGWVLESTETSGVGGSLDSAAAVFRLGDEVADKQYRSIISFNTGILPDNAIIQTAVLKIKQNGLPVGTNPFTASLGSLWADIKTGVFGANAQLALEDFNAPASATAVGAFGSTPVSTYYILTLNATGENSINKSGRTQFRLRFGIDDNNNSLADYMKFLSGDATSGLPQLTITYTLP